MIKYYNDSTSRCLHSRDGTIYQANSLHSRPCPLRILSLSFPHKLSVRILYLNLRIDLGSESVFLISCPTFREETSKLLLESKPEWMSALSTASTTSRAVTSMQTQKTTHTYQKDLLSNTQLITYYLWRHWPFWANSLPGFPLFLRRSLRCALLKSSIIHTCT